MPETSHSEATAPASSITDSAASTPGAGNVSAEGARVPQKPSLNGLEQQWISRWSDQQVYRFTPDVTRDQVYSIDTPPPTASGSLHVGHVFSYTQTDVIARYQRMCGKKVFYPMGWDDNGLPTERRVQNYFGVRCDPKLPYDPQFSPPEKAPKNERDFVNISRRNFIELCEKLAVDDEKIYEDLFRTLGLSVDWDLTYRTIDAHSRAVSQEAFLANLAAGDAYSQEAPTLWDVTFRTAVAQAELEDREREGAYHRIAFHKTSDGSPVFIESTRPELIPACVALVAHPDDERYQPLFGTTVKSPLFEVEVPVLAHGLAQPDKGSGIAMICTFGDLTDVIWWRELNLPARPVVGQDGRIIQEVPQWISADSGHQAYAELAGKTTFSARTRIAELLKDSGDLEGEPRKITHPVNFFEKGDKPLEVITTRQWYIRNGGRDAARREQLIARGTEFSWHPEHMRHRYDNWISGLNGDWLVSRQRYFGVPIPLWYQLDESGNPDYDHPIVPSVESLPVDPAAEAAPGYAEDQRNQPGGFTGDPDVLDTWATSSLTPQLVGGWGQNPSAQETLAGATDGKPLFDKVFPFDLRPQGHDIIRTWLFSTVVRADALNHSIPWKNVALSGWILDPDRKKMSKSKGNVVVPSDVLAEYGSDAVRYWAASAKLGIDTAYDIGQMKIGRRLAIKLLNASKFVLSQGVTAQVLSAPPETVTEPLDVSLLKNLADVVENAQQAFDNYDYARALNLTESFFWTFTDDYLELVKDRAYGVQGEAGQLSAHITLGTALDVLLRLFAPFLPFVTEEVWSWWREDSVHIQQWPTTSKLPVTDAHPADTATLASVGAALSVLRKIKSEAKVSQKTRLVSATVQVSPADRERLLAAQGDLVHAGRVDSLTVTPDGEPGTFTVLDSELEQVPES